VFCSCSDSLLQLGHDRADFLRRRPAWLVLDDRGTARQGFSCERCCEIEGDGRLAGTALLIDDGYNHLNTPFCVHGSTIIQKDDSLQT
jgi:hypothetical protein